MRSELIRCGPPEMTCQPAYHPSWKERAALGLARAVGPYWQGYEAVFDMRKFPFYATPRHYSELPNNPPRRIVCSHLDYNGEFRYWVADCVERGSELHILQHGGGFGSMAEMGLEEHYMSICDVFHSWGWTGPKVEPWPSWWLGRLKQRVRLNPNGYIYWVLTAVPKQPYRKLSMPQGEAFQDYLEDQFRLAALLSPELRRQIVLRLYPEDYGWNIEQQFRQRFPDITIEKPGVPIAKGLSGARLVIVTANLTTLLETLACNIPTVAFWNPNQWLLRESARRYYDALRGVGILNDSPEQAAERLRNPAPWYDFILQSARRDFCREFAGT